MTANLKDISSMKYVTTLEQIRSFSPCKDSWEKLLQSQGTTQANSKPLHMLTILDVLGIRDAIWCLRVFGEDPQVRRYAAWCARQVLHIFESERPGDNRPRLAIEAAEAYADGKISKEELEAAWAAADAARATASAWDAARYAAGAAWAAAEAARSAASAWDAVRAAAWTLARTAAEAARAAAWAAAWAAARAADAAAGAARAAVAAAAAAQEAKFREMFSE